MSCIDEVFGKDRFSDSDSDADPDGAGVAVMRRARLAGMRDELRRSTSNPQ